MKQFYFRRCVASLMALLALSLLSLRALADEAPVTPPETVSSSSSSSASEPEITPAPVPMPAVLISRSDVAVRPSGRE